MKNKIINYIYRNSWNIIIALTISILSFMVSDTWVIGTWISAACSIINWVIDWIKNVVQGKSIEVGKTEINPFNWNFVIWTFILSVIINLIF